MDPHPGQPYRPEDVGNDDVGLISGIQVPSVKITSAIEQPSSVRGRRHSRDLTNMDVDSISEYPTPGESPDGSSKARRPSPGASGATSLLRRLTTTLRSPTHKSRPSRRALGGNYDTLDDGDFDNVPVDLSSLTGMGFELTDMHDSGKDGLQDQDTAYNPQAVPSEKPSFRQFVQKGPKIGDGFGNRCSTEEGSVKGSGGSCVLVRQLLETPAIKRAKTRSVGHSLAQERNMIVAVNEGVDLSSLEGRDLTQIARGSTLSLDQIARRAGQLDNGPQSYFFPEDNNIPNWRPFSMRSFYILGLGVVSLGLAIFQEWLYQYSKSRQTGKNGTGGLLKFNQVSDISVWDFFAWKYMPTMITILYAVLFSIMDFDIRRLEPYYQLSQPLGGRAAASLNLDHLTTFQYFVPFKAFRLKQWPVFFSTIGNILASLIAPSIQNPSLNFITNLQCTIKDNQCPEGEFHFYVQVSSPWSRALSAVLVIVAIITVVEFFLLRRPSGLLSDPKGIAGIASMATKSHILNDFKDLDLATRGEIHKRLQHRRYVLYKSSIWQGEYSAANEPMQDSEQRMESPHPPMLRLAYGIPFIGSMVFGLIFVPLISLTKARVIPNDVQWLPILLATLLKLFFTTFESDVRLMEPFYQLSRGKSQPQNSLTLDYQGTVYGWVVIKALLNGHYLVALVGVASVSLDILTVTISSFSVNSAEFLVHDEKTSNQDETFISFWTSVILSIVVLTFVIFVTSLVYLRRRHPFLPREPSTIAAVLAFIYASNMLDDFINTETFTHKQMQDRLKATGKTYALGWFRGRDGKIHCAIDQEPLRSKYVHGKSYIKAQAPWEQTDEFV